MRKTFIFVKIKTGKTVTSQQNIAALLWIFRNYKRVELNRPLAEAAK